MSKKDKQPTNLNFYRRKRECIETARKNTGISPGARLLLMELLTRSNQAWRGVWMSQSRMAEYIGVSVRTIDRHLAELQDAFLVRRAGRLTRADGKWSTVVYECQAFREHYDEHGVTQSIAPDAPGKFVPELSTKLSTACQNDRPTTDKMAELNF